MITVLLRLSNLNYNLKIDLELPVLPSVGHQFFLTDFMSESEVIKFEKTNKNVDLDAMFVNSICWMYDKIKKKPYVHIWLSSE